MSAGQWASACSRKARVLKFEPTDVHGAWLIRPEPRTDARGHFARLWCRDELAAQGLETGLAQINTGFNPAAGTLRGLHLQLPPHAEVKIVRCTRGAVFDVAVDLRRDSPTYRRWFGAVLTPDDGSMLYVPRGCAHGYLTLQPDTELVYLASVPYAQGAARGLRHDDPAIGIAWPREASLISEADAKWPSLAQVESEWPAQSSEWDSK
jgi:dTDP-4-dehydrorhamnose 3,5-epimerase